MLDSRVLSTRAGAWERACLARAVNVAAPNPLPCVPARLLGSGFEFLYPTWPEAARELCSRVR